MEVLLTQFAENFPISYQKRLFAYGALLTACVTGVLFTPNVAHAAWSVSNSIPQTNTFSVSSQDTLPRDIQFKPDGTKMYVLGGTSNSVHEYSLSKAWSPITASFVQSFSVASEEASPAGVFFKPDGTKMYITGNGGQEVNEYTLSTPWSVSSATFVQLFSIATEETVPQGIFFRDDGLKMYIAGSTGDDVNEYTLSSAWNVSTAVFTRVSTQITQDTVPTGLFFKSDGTKLFVMGGGNDVLREYNLTTPWNVGSVTFVKQFSVAGQEAGPQGVSFKDDGTKMYVVGSAGVDVNEYILPSGFTKPPNNLGLLGYWSFEDATSTVATDFSGNGRHGTLSGNAVTWVNGKRGSALQFGGTDDNVNLGAIAALDGAQKVTVSAWIYDTAGAASKSIFSRFSASPNDPSMGLYTSDAGNGGGQSISFTPDGQEAVFSTGNVHQTNRWEHWVAVYDGSQATDLDKVVLYLNGVAQAKNITSTPLASTIDSSAQVVRIGSDSDQLADFTGLIDEVRVYNRALGSTEVAGLFGTGGGAVGVSNSTKKLQKGTKLGNGLTALWTFDGADLIWNSAVSASARDGSGNNQHVTLGSFSRTNSPVMGKLGQALYFNGVDDNATAGSAASAYVSASDATIAAWVKPEGAAPVATDVSVGAQQIITTAVDNIGFSRGSIGGLDRVWAFNLDGNYDSVGITYTAGEWTHVALVHTGGTLSAYKNGELVSSVASGDTQDLSNNLTFGLGLGTRYMGSVDDVRTYNRSLSASEVRQLYRLGQTQIRQ